MSTAPPLDISGTVYGETVDQLDTAAWALAARVAPGRTVTLAYRQVVAGSQPPTLRADVLLSVK